MKASLVTCGLLAALAAGVRGEAHPVLKTYACTAAGCVTENSGIVLDNRWYATAAQYAANGIDISGDVLKLTIKDGAGPRVYLTASDTSYKMIKMVGKELSYDVETSQLDCDTNGALYFVQMPESGGKDGSGYCDANCVGGTCCPEMDIWEANKYATVFTTHSTSNDGAGVGYNPYANGLKNFYGPGSSYTVDTTQPFKVITRFITDSSGQVSEMKRLYQQNGKTINGGSLTASARVAAMGEAMRGGSVLAFSIWSGYMAWLDSGNNGPCPTGAKQTTATITFSNIRVGDIGTTSSAIVPTTAPTTVPTTGPTVAPTTKPVTTAPTTAPTAAPGGTVAKWGQCGGSGYTGPTACVAGSTCTAQSQWYSQCQ